MEQALFIAFSTISIYEVTHTYVQTRLQFQVFLL